MFKNIMLPVQIKKVKDPNGKMVLKSTVPMNIIFDRDFDAIWLEKELLNFEKRYLYLVTCLKSLLESIRTKKHERWRVLLYWEFGNKIVEFVENNKKTAFFLEALTKTLSRDVGASYKMIWRCRRFRLLYPDFIRVNPNKSFHSYLASFESGYISTKKQAKKRKRKTI